MTEKLEADPRGVLQHAVAQAILQRWDTLVAEFRGSTSLRTSDVNHARRVISSLGLAEPGTIAYGGGK